MNESPEFLYQICVDLFLAALAMWVLAQIVSKFSVKILGVKKEILMPVIYVLCVVGSFVINHIMFDVKVMFVFGIIGFFLSAAEFPAAPFLLGVILGFQLKEGADNQRRQLPAHVPAADQCYFPHCDCGADSFTVPCI